jgi:hypothetical protein
MFEDIMRNINGYLFSITLLFAVNVYANPGSPAAIVIERSPSACPDMPKFFDAVEDRVTKAHTQGLQEKFVIDFNLILLNLFSRLKKATDFERQLWEKGFNLLAERLAGKYNICGLKIVYGDTDDIQYLAALAEPLLKARKLESCDITAAAEFPARGALSPMILSPMVLSPRTPEATSPKSSASSPRIPVVCPPKSPTLMASPLVLRASTPK